MVICKGKKGRVYKIGEQISDTSKGVEGYIRSILDDETIVAKIYKDTILNTRRKELELRIELLMSKDIEEEIGDFQIAWPRDLLYVEDDGKQKFVGYTMRKISAEYTLWDLIRKTDSDSKSIQCISWKHSFQAAYNLAWFVNYLHSKDVVLGDFNENNFLFNNENGGFGLIDCGSYGVFSGKGWVVNPYIMPQYQAPETLAGLQVEDPRQTDYFYLAVLIFNLLTNNSNPFRSVPMDDENALSASIMNGECVYVRRILGKNIPRSSVKPGVLPEDVLKAFYKTFNYTKDTIASNLNNRTTAYEWCVVLNKHLKENTFTVCKSNKTHVYSSHLKECPWCFPGRVSDIPYEELNTSNPQIDIARAVTKPEPKPAPKPAATSAPKPAATSTSKPAATSTSKPAATSTSKPAPNHKSKRNNIRNAITVLLLIFIALIPLPYFLKEYGNHLFEQENYQSARLAYSYPALLGSDEAQCKLGYMYFKGLGVTPDNETAYKWFLKAARHGNADAKYHVGVMYFNGFGEDENAEEVIEWVKEAGEENPKAMVLIGEAYEAGKRLDQHYNLAMEWYKKASDLGDADAHFHIAELYRKGLGVSQNNLDAFFWYLKAAEQEDAEAYYSIGRLYADGEGFTQDIKYADEWMYKAVQLGNEDAINWYKAIVATPNLKYGSEPVIQYHIGNMFENGVGYTKNYETAIHWYLKAAEQGNSDAQYHLGQIYENGLGVSQDFPKAFEFYRKSAEHKNANAQYSVGLMYENGKGVEKNVGESLQYYLDAAFNGNAEASTKYINGTNSDIPNNQCNIGDLYYYGDGIEQDYSKAMEWYQKAAKQDNAYAQHSIGYLYYAGEGVEKDYSKAFDWFQKASNNGFARSQFFIGLMYKKGYGFDQDFNKAMEWLIKAANNGDVSAQCEIASMYKDGVGVEQNSSTAFTWYLKAAESGETTAQNWLAYMYQTGDGVDQDYKKAYEWYLKAAEQNDDYALVSLGKMHLEGLGVETNYYDAVTWFVKAIWNESSYSKDDSNSMISIGSMYRDGCGVTKDYSEAFSWYMKAANLGNDDGQAWLGYMYENGEGVDIDLDKAIEWYKLSADQNNNFSIEALERLT